MFIICDDFMNAKDFFHWLKCIKMFVDVLLKLNLNNSCMILFSHA
jgi:hypothetical protein